jgi:VanZ family protein
MPTKHIFVVLGIITFLALGYYPFHWEIPSNFKLHTDEKLIRYDAKSLSDNTTVFGNTNAELLGTTLKLSKSGIAYLLTSPSWMREAISNSFLKIELSIQTDISKQFGPARIFTISKDAKYRNITVAQQGDDLVLRLRVGSNLNGTPAFVIKNVFMSPEKIDILIKISNRDLEILVNGLNRLATKIPHDALSNWDTDYKLALGNELTFDRPWLGKIYKAVISTNTQSIDYIKNNLLQVPEIYSVTHYKEKNVRLVIFDNTGSVYDWLPDYAINFLGFFMLGIFLRFLTNKNISYITLITVCVLLSLGIEVGQLFLETRSTAIHDFVLNSAGGVCGVLFGTWLIMHLPMLPNR